LVISIRVIAVFSFLILEFCSWELSGSRFGVFTDNLKKNQQALTIWDNSVSSPTAGSTAEEHDFAGWSLRMVQNVESFMVRAEEPSCYFTTGFLNGFFSAVKNQHVKETKCISMGDPHCEWEFT